MVKETIKLKGGVEEDVDNSHTSFPGGTHEGGRENLIEIC
jgi:hypothetical protein